MGLYFIYGAAYNGSTALVFVAPECRIKYLMVRNEYDSMLQLDIYGWKNGGNTIRKHSQRRTHGDIYGIVLLVCSVCVNAIWSMCATALMKCVCQLDDT